MGVAESSPALHQEKGCQSPPGAPAGNGKRSNLPCVHLLAPRWHCALAHHAGQAVVQRGRSWVAGLKWSAHPAARRLEPGRPLPRCCCFCCQDGSHAAPRQPALPALSLPQTFALQCRAAAFAHPSSQRQPGPHASPHPALLPSAHAAATPLAALSSCASSLLHGQPAEARMWPGQRRDPAEAALHGQSSGAASCLSACACTCTDRWRVRATHTQSTNNSFM